MSISKFLPAEKKELMNVQAKVDRELAEETKAALKANGDKTWTEFFEASMRAYLAEVKAKKQRGTA